MRRPQEPRDVPAAAARATVRPARRRIAGSPCFAASEGWFGASRGIYNAAGVRLGYASQHAGPYTGRTYSVYVGTQLGSITVGTHVNTLAQAADLLAAYANGSGQGS